ncbi:PepSY-like domain-containing protein [Salegentibacter chungangensis]|uniref:PepSY-like domain-containing protein n=1 Tax=Salegentibacter chungangensis TaxID=1335724 RepID=A0ABW3NSZ7_9FLAO
MKKLMILSLAGIGFIAISACSNDDDAGNSSPEVNLNATAFSSDSHVNTSALPQPILDYITTNYPDQVIREAEIEDNNNYEVELSNGLELIFDAEGNFLGVDDDGEDNFGDDHLDASELPQKIKDFLNTYFEGETVEEAEIENNGHIKVELDSDVKLIFDAEGNFLGQAEDENENEDEDDEDIAVEDLPQSVKDYISANYPDNKIIEAEKEDEGFEVTLNNGTELKFDSEGNFVKAEDHNGDDDDDEEETDD